MATPRWQTIDTDGLTDGQTFIWDATAGKIMAVDIIPPDGSGKLAKSVAGGTDVTLTDAESGNGNIEFTGVLTANINVIVPDAKRFWRVYNSTTGAFTLTIKTQSGDGVAVEQGSAKFLESNGTDVVSVG